MSLELKIKSLAEVAATTIKNVDQKTGNLASLSTTEKSSIVAALNELNLALLAIPVTAIDDENVSVSSTYSSQKIENAINDAIANLVNGADVDNDSLKELADKIAALAQTDNGLVSATTNQTFTAAQKTKARTNIGAASQSDLDSLAASVGDTDRDFVADFNAVYNS